MKPAFQCPRCNFRFRTDARNVGRRIRCPRAECDAEFQLRQSGADPATAASAQRPPAIHIAGSRPAASVQVPPSRAEQRSRRMLQKFGSVSRTSDQKFSFRSMFVAVGILLGCTGVAAGVLNSFGLLPESLTGVVAQTESSQSADDILAAAGDALPVSLSEQDIRLQQRQEVLDKKILPYLRTYCLDCHGPDEQEGGIRVDTITDPREFLTDHRKWERVYRMLNAGAMPPAGHEPVPSKDEHQEVLDAIYDEIYNFDCELVQHAGRPAVQRLNRAEYNNTIRDLFGVSITPADDFPQDDVGEGFDNIGDVLSVPPLLLEKYLDAAESVAAEVIDTRDFSKGLRLDFPADKLRMADRGRPAIDSQGFGTLSTTGRIGTRVSVPVAGEYLILIEANATQAGNELARMALLIDGESQLETEIPGHRELKTVEQVVTLTEGEHLVAAAFLNDFYEPEAEDPKRRDRNMGVRRLTVSGPLGGDVDLHHELHRRIVTVRPSESVGVRQAATQVLQPLLTRAFRRPATDAEVDRYAALVDSVVTEHDESYDYGMFVAVQAILVSPEFLFRLETAPADAESAEDRALNDYEIASRLSYFLWSTMPDDELFRLAQTGELHQPQVLREQVDRMLQDPRATTLGDNFAAQWLNLRNLAEVDPNPELFPDFNEELRADMAQETLHFFNSLVSDDRPVAEFLNADYTYVNQRLAEYYGLPTVDGEGFQRVSLAGTKRSGVLTHASILTLTSNPGRTSPVKRGKWILENILAQAPPPAPPGVPDLEESADASANLSLREQLEIHRADPGCAVCHITMDALGMGFENFDAIGRWRDEEAGKPVDASGDLPDGGHFSGAIELIGILEQQQDKFIRAFTEKLMTYALGRGLEYYDRCAVDRIVESTSTSEHRFSALVKAIVLSDPFLKRSSTREVSTPLAQR